jgi:outer membrane protein assembly factor BamA
MAAIFPGRSFSDSLFENDSLLQLPLSAIYIVGNDHTHEDVILRELLFSAGDTATDSLLAASKKRLENLWLFNRVEFMPLPGNGDWSLLISVTERLYIFPYPVFNFEDRDWKKLTYGFGFAHENFRGRNEKLYLSLSFGERPGWHFTYFNPWVNSKWHLLTGFYIRKYIMQNHSDKFDENHLYLAVNFGKYWTRYFHSNLSVTRDRIRLADSASLYYHPSTETNYGLNFSNALDTRDLYAYPSRGQYLFFRLRYQGFFEPQPDYWQYVFDLRQYLNFKRLILAGRLHTKQSIGTLPIYDRVYFGYDERIRGHFSEVKEGRHSFLASIDLRFPLLPVRYLTFNTGLLPELYTKNLKFGVNAGLFLDSGVVWKTKREFGVTNFNSGFGAGLHFLAPYIEVLRFDLAFNEKLSSEFIMEVQVAF